jgi:SAM-dependent methyltransferase
VNTYGTLSAEFYDLDKPVAPALALEWYLERLKSAAGPVLEPMCGSGRFLVPLNLRDLHVDGADPAPAMLDACARRLAAAGLEGVRLYPQTLEALDPGREYAGAFIPASSFCLLSRPAARAGLARLREVLLPGAPILLEFELPHGLSSWPATATRTITRGGMQIRLESRVDYDVAAQVEVHTNRYERKRSGRVVETEDETLRLQCYAPDELRALLESAGFTGIEIEHPEFGWVATAVQPSR